MPRCYVAVLHWKSFYCYLCPCPAKQIQMIIKNAVKILNMDRNVNLQSSSFDWNDSSPGGGQMIPSQMSIHD